ncbi:TetR/AcrR family transcriptional regulator [Pseudomonas sp.]|uniref:TetR/AcrR family transcriptional regulator n=1 Tax=Pseudomonas sp. TaxID=306 RepID=UPI00261A4F26|nr:TetR/AcrR family transcriptional regulator [Pseudomonas sp.]
MKLFWEHGYEGTSFDDLISAMKISPSTFYNSFGNKETLYREATDHYLAISSEWFQAALTGVTDAKTAFTRLIEATAAQFTCDDLPAGCMISLAGTHLSPAHGSVRALMSAHRAASENALVARLKEALAAGEIPPGTDIDALGAYFSALFRGMAVQARDGASRARVLAIGRLGMGAWPEPNATPD